MKIEDLQVKDGWVPASLHSRSVTVSADRMEAQTL
jgi:hypothetical protein